jgi:uncharacterized protein
MLTGVIHLPALPGSPLAKVSLERIREQVRVEAKILEKCGFGAIILENFGDTPFFRDAVPAITVSTMTVLALAVREAAPKVKLGINVLRNDGLSALSIAAAVSAQFIRVNILTGARVTDQGVIQGDAATLLRTRKALGLSDIEVWADADVKHSAPLGTTTQLHQEVEDLVHRAMASAVLVTGEGTGKGPALAKLRAVRAAAGDVPVYVASGATLADLPQLRALASGVIVGSALRAGGKAGGKIDAARAQAFAKAFHKA